MRETTLLTGAVIPGYSLESGVRSSAYMRLTGYAATTRVDRLIRTSVPCVEESTELGVRGLGNLGMNVNVNFVAFLADGNSSVVVQVGQLNADVLA